MTKKKKKRKNKVEYIDRGLTAQEIREKHSKGNSFDRMKSGDQGFGNPVPAPIKEKIQKPPNIPNRLTVRNPRRKKNRLPFIKTGKYKDYLLTPYWQELRLVALNYYGNKCSVCKTIDNLQVHHKRYCLFEEELDDLCVLCRDCHTSEHSDKMWPTDEITRQYRRMFDESSEVHER